MAISNNLINATLSNKKVITSNLQHILQEISPEQRNELESLLINLKNGQPEEQKAHTNKLSETTHSIAAGYEMKTKVVKEPGDLVFYEYGVFLGIVIGRSKNKDVIKMMQQYSDCLIINENISKFSALYFYRDLDIAFCFDENNIVKEITLGKNFKGMTSKGLKIKDNIARAIEFYGKPKEMTTGSINTYTWDNFLIFSEEKIITHIRFI